MSSPIDLNCRGYVRNLSDSATIPKDKDYG